MRTSESVKNISEALCKFQGKITSVKKDSENPFFHSTYADLESVVSHVRKELYDYGLSVVQLVEGKTLVTRICHISGEWIEASAELAVKNANNAQDIYASVTYFRRMAYTGGLGIVCTDEDDDGNKCSQDSKPKQEAKPQTSTKQEPPKEQAVAAPTEQPAGETHTGKLVDVQEKHGTNKKTGKPWTKYGIQFEDGEVFGTFDQTLAETAISLIEAEVVLGWKQEGKFKTAVSVDPVIEKKVDGKAASTSNLPF